MVRKIGLAVFVVGLIIGVAGGIMRLFMPHHRFHFTGNFTHAYTNYHPNPFFMLFRSILFIGIVVMALGLIIMFWPQKKN